MNNIQSCPNYNADASNRVLKEVEASLDMHRGTLKLITDKHIMLGSPIKMLLCKRCGNIQFFVDPTEFKDV